MKIIIAPQGFKGGISGLEAARAIARGVLAAAPEAETVLLPVADGGDGTLHALVDATGGENPLLAGDGFGAGADDDRRFYRGRALRR